MFGDCASGAFLHRLAWTNIVRHQMVKYRASPDDPELADYWDTATSDAAEPRLIHLHCNTTRQPPGLA